MGLLNGGSHNRGVSRSFSRHYFSVVGVCLSPHRLKPVSRRGGREDPKDPESLEDADPLHRGNPSARCFVSHLPGNLPIGANLRRVGLLQLFPRTCHSNSAPFFHTRVFLF